MEIAISAPTGGRVREVLVSRNAQVDAGAPLLRLEPLADADADESATGDAVSFAALAGEGLADPRDRNLERLVLLRSVVLGYDVEPAAARRVVADYVSDRQSLLLAHDVDLDKTELAVLSAFADVGAVTRDRRRNEGDHDEQSSPREQFNSYLRAVERRPRRAARAVPRPARPCARPLRRDRPHALGGPARGAVPDLRRPSPAGGLRGDHHQPARSSAERPPAGDATQPRSARAARPADRRHVPTVAGHRQPGAQRALPVLRRTDRPRGPAAGGAGGQRRPRPVAQRHRRPGGDRSAGGLPAAAAADRRPGLRAARAAQRRRPAGGAHPALLQDPRPGRDDGGGGRRAPRRPLALRPRATDRGARHHRSARRDRRPARGGVGAGGRARPGRHRDARRLRHCRCRGRARHRRAGRVAWPRRSRRRTSPRPSAGSR